MEVEVAAEAQKDIRRFGWAKAFLLEAELKDLRHDPSLISRLRPLTSSDGRPLVRIELTEPFVARAQITPEGLLIERVVTTQELDDTADEFFGHSK